VYNICQKLIISTSALQRIATEVIMEPSLQTRTERLPMAHVTGGAILRYKGHSSKPLRSDPKWIVNGTESHRDQRYYAKSRGRPIDHMYRETVSKFNAVFGERKLE